MLSETVDRALLRAVVVAFRDLGSTGCSTLQEDSEHSSAVPCGAWVLVPFHSRFSDEEHCCWDQDQLSSSLSSQMSSTFDLLVNPSVRCFVDSTSWPFSLSFGNTFLSPVDG